MRTLVTRRYHVFSAAALLTALVLLSGACSDGGLDDARDHYMSVFGLPRAEPGVHKGGVIARALHTDGSPAAWAQVYARPEAEGARRNPVPAMTNAKGGFYLGDLEPGAYQIFVLSPSSQGIDYHVDVKEGEIVENEGLALEALARVSGHVTLKNESSHTGVMIFVPGTPFSAFSDQDGSYYLDLPHGTYKLRAERDTFTPFESEALAVTGDREVDITLAPNPWPHGRVTIVGSEDGFVVRGLKTKLKIEPGPGVRRMRVRDGYSERILAADGSGNDWPLVRRELELAYKAESLHSLQFEFMDAYGKKSEPVTVSFFNTKLDKSWTILHGTIKRPVMIPAGRKVRFVASDDIDLSTEISTGASTTGSGLKFSRSTAARFDDAATVSVSGDDAGTIFTKAVTVEAGAVLRGGASFQGPLMVKGTRERPVVWNAGAREADDSVSLYGPTLIRHAKIQGVYFASSPLAQDRTEFEHVELAHFYVMQPFFKIMGPQSPGGGVWSFRNSSLSDGYFRQDCNDTISGEASDDSESDDEATGTSTLAESASPLTFELTGSVVANVGISLTCRLDLSGFKPTVKLDHNNFLAVRTAETYFESDVYATDENGEEIELPFPDAAQIDYIVTENHFREPSRLFRGSDQGAWPEFMGVNRVEPWDDAGP
jgi:hypothetical protein